MTGAIEMEGPGYHGTEYVPKRLDGSPRKSKSGCQRWFNNLLKAVVAISFTLTIALLLIFGDFTKFSTPVIEVSSLNSDAAVSDIEALTGEDSVGIGLGLQPKAEYARHSVSHIGVRTDPAMQDCLTGGMKQTFPDIDYSFYGYNILKGYPLADGRDPGFTRPLFAFNFSSHSHTADCRYSLPKGLIAAPDVACRTSFTSKTVSNSQELKESLGVNAKVNGGGFGVSFSASADYKKASSTVSKGETKLIQSTASCKYYFSKLNQLDMPDLSQEMKEWLKRLEKSLKRHNIIDDKLIYEFVNYFGTHFPITMVYGARFTYENRVSSESYESLAESSLSVDIQASYSGAFSLGGGFGMTKSKSDAAKRFSEEVETSTLSVGAPPPYNGDAMTWASTVKDTPVPVDYELVPIHELFDKEYNIHHHFDDEQTAERIRSEIMNIATSYCRMASEKGLDVQCNDDSVIKFEDVSIRISDIDNDLKFNKTLGQCIEECRKRSGCIMMSMWPSGTLELGSGKRCGLQKFSVQRTPQFRHNGRPIRHRQYRDLASCEGCQTFIMPQVLEEPIELNGFQYDSLVTRRNQLNISTEGLNYYDLKNFCSLHCSQDIRCTGFEVSDKTDYNYNCATYSQHSERLIATDSFLFETNIMADLAKQKVSEYYYTRKRVYTYDNTLAWEIPSNGVQLIDQCDHQCCQSRCESNLNCISSIQINKTNQHKCYLVLDQFESVVKFTPTAEISLLTIAIFTERSSSGWFNISGCSYDGTVRVQEADNYDACGDKCASDIKCDYASWDSRTNRCYKISKGTGGTNFKARQDSMLMFPNHRERVMRFRLPN